MMEEDDGLENQSEAEVDPSSYFHLGQFLRAKVVSTRKEGTGGQSSKKHIELSVHPRETNQGSSANTVVGSMVQGSIASIEDHGIIMDLGFEDPTVRGFLPHNELPSGLESSRLIEGAVILCLVTGSGANGRTTILSANPARIGEMQKKNMITDAPTVDVLLPGTAVEFLISAVTNLGVLGKAMGLVDVTADLVHSKATLTEKSLDQLYVTKSKARGRVICTFPASEGQKVAVSMLDHIIAFKQVTAVDQGAEAPSEPTQVLPLSAIVEQAKVVKVLPGIGLLVDLGTGSVPGFVHISRISDGRIETLAEMTGKYKLGSKHKCRVVGYNPMDGLFIVSLEKKIIEQPFLRIEDVLVGQRVKGCIEKLIVSEKGVTGILVKIAEGITALVPETHFSDTKLQHPEQRFKEGKEVKARVLSVDLFKRQIRLTMKNSLVNSDRAPWTTYDNLVPGMRSPGSIINLLPTGAVMQFYGAVRAFLPASEMSESFIEDPRAHFRIGQVLEPWILSVQPSAAKMLVTCKDSKISDTNREAGLANLNIGDMVQGSVIEKNTSEIIVELTASSLKGMIPVGHLVDGSEQKAIGAAKRIRVGQMLKDILILDKQNPKRPISLSGKPSLVDAAKENRLPSSFEGVIEGAKIDGFVSNITDAGAFVRFAGRLTGLLPKSKMPIDWTSQPQFGLRKDQSISAKVLKVDYLQQRFLLSMDAFGEGKNTPNDGTRSEQLSLINPTNGTSPPANDFTLDQLTKAKITSVKITQINVQLAENVQGRIDASEVFDKFEDIEDHAKPLKNYRKNQVLPVRIMGIHDTRNHRFLPISHRGKAPVFELTAKPQNQTSQKLDILTLDKVRCNETYIVFVNNVRDDHLWVNLSPNVRGRISAMDVSDDVSRMNDLSTNFPVGSALRARVINVDVKNDRLDLTARSTALPRFTTLEDLSPGLVLPGRITKVTERHVMVQLSDCISGPVNLTDLADDYSKADPTIYHKNQIVRICIKDVDPPNSRIIMSLRPSRVLSSELPVVDPDIASISKVNLDGVYRGFVKNVTDNGLFVSLASNITAFIRITDLSDNFLKDWKAEFENDQLVKGKVIEINTDVNRVRMSLKSSHLDPNYKPPMTFESLKVGQTVTGKVRKVQDYGVFVVVDDSANVSGLCHRSEISDQRGANPVNLYNEGDKVQAKVLKIDRDTRRVSLGLKASYFKTEIDDGEDSDLMGGVELSGDSESEVEEDLDMSGVQLESEEDSEPDVERQGADSGQDIESSADEQDTSVSRPNGLTVGGFDWTGGATENGGFDHPSDADDQVAKGNKRRKRKGDLQADKTGDLDTNGPQKTTDFERLLMGNPHSSQLWINYMAFHLGLSEIDKARQIGQRALETIDGRYQNEKTLVRTALFNLEVEYGNEASLDRVFEEACQLGDNLEMHEILASICIQGRKYDKADGLLQKAVKKHSQNPEIYTNYARFLMDQLNDPPRARALLPRALQALPNHTHVSLTSKFAKLEFDSPNGEAERGRTMFEGLLNTFPKRLDLRHVLLDLEMSQGSGTPERVRRLFERTVGGSEVQLNKSRQIIAFFNKWQAFEEKEGDQQSQSKVRREREKALQAAQQRRAAREALIASTQLSV